MVLIIALDRNEYGKFRLMSTTKDEMYYRCWCSVHYFDAAAIHSVHLISTDFDLDFILFLRFDDLISVSLKMRTFPIHLLRFVDAALQKCGLYKIKTDSERDGRRERELQFEVNAMRKSRKTAIKIMFYSLSRCIKIPQDYTLFFFFLSMSIFCSCQFSTAFYFLKKTKSIADRKLLSKSRTICGNSSFWLKWIHHCCAYLSLFCAFNPVRSMRQRAYQKKKRNINSYTLSTCYLTRKPAP